jgi:hypothetical protein
MVLVTGRSKHMDFGDVIVGQQALDRISGLYHWLAKSITLGLRKIAAHYP